MIIEADNLRLHWSEWNKLVLPDGMTIFDPDGFRHGKPQHVTFAEFLDAREECTMVFDTSRCNPYSNFHAIPHKGCVLRG